MRRPYSTSRFGDIVSEIRRKIPHAGIGTDLIVGFPGETEKEHQETVAFIRKMPFTYLHVFPYSDRPGTLSSQMKDKVQPEVLRQRGAELRQLSESKKDAFRSRFVGKRLLVLTLTETVDSSREGLSGNYLQVKMNPEIPGNRLVEGRVDGLEGDFLVLADEGLRVLV
jgi:threonylcarbamoyladenosine tRNA methylthiotransferase MtaB